MMTIRAKENQRGVILIALLWVLVALSLIALTFSREGFVEVAVARNSRDLTDAYYIARAGIAVTAYRLLERRLFPPVQGVELPGPPDPLDLGELKGEFGGGSFKVEIQDESGKINLNFVTEEHLRALIEVIGIPKQDGDVIVDSIMDWKDVDTAHRINGAEEEYYQSLPRPYKPKNGRLDTVEELLLVRGVTREYHYGFPEKGADGAPIYRYGLARNLSVYSNSNRINVNFAPLPVLLSIPGMPPQVAQAIYERRKAKPFKTLAELTQEIATPLGPATLPLLSTDQTGVYTLTASGSMANSKVKRLIRAVISLDPREPQRYKVIYWNENVPDV